MTRTDNGLFLVIDGIDGAGKTTQAARLASFFECAGESVVQSKEPTNGPWGQKIRQSAMHGRMSLPEELEAFIQDRNEHLRDLILPSLAAGKVVILDRYFYSTIAYQGSRGGDVDALAAQMTTLAPTPDLAFILDLLPELGLTRISEGRGDTPNSFEALDNLRVVRKAFRHLVQTMPKLVQIDATPPADAVQGEMMRVLIDGVLKDRYCEKPWGCDGMMCGYRMTGACRWARFARAAGSTVSMPRSAAPAAGR